jgi:hypothetical protein
MFGFLLLCHDTISQQWRGCAQAAPRPRRPIASESC